MVKTQAGLLYRNVEFRGQSVFAGVVSPCQQKSTRIMDEQPPRKSVVDYLVVCK